MKSVVVCFVISCLAASLGPAVAQGGCTSIQRLITGRCHMINVDEENWEDARSGCMDSNAELVDISSEDQRDGIINYVNSETSENMMYKKFWVAAKVEERNGERKWRWQSTGEEVNPTYFSNVPSTNNPSRECAYFCTVTTKLWASSCDGEFPYICVSQPSQPYTYGRYRPGGVGEMRRFG